MTFVESLFSVLLFAVFVQGQQTEPVERQRIVLVDGVREIEVAEQGLDVSARLRLICMIC